MKHLSLVALLALAPTVLASNSLSLLTPGEQKSPPQLQKPAEPLATPDVLDSHGFASTNLYEARAHLDKFVARVRIPDTPAAILNADILDRYGREVKFRMLASEEMGLILGTHLEGVLLSQTHLVEEGGQFFLIISAVRNGQPFLPSKEDLHLTDLSHRDFCFDVEPVSASDVAVNINLAVDISGSMSDVMSDVRTSIAEFLTRVPSHAQCQVILFDQSPYLLDPTDGSLKRNGAGFESCAAFQTETALGAVKSYDGGTRIARALAPIYRNHRTNQDALNLLLVISDGIGNESRRAFGRLRAMRDVAVEQNGIFTAVNWLGDYDTSYPLQSIADEEVVGILDNERVSERFFNKLSYFLAAQAKVTPRPCEDE